MTCECLWFDGCWMCFFALRFVRTVTKFFAWGAATHRMSTRSAPEPSQLSELNRFLWYANRFLQCSRRGNARVWQTRAFDFSLFPSAEGTAAASEHFRLAFLQCKHRNFEVQDLTMIAKPYMILQLYPAHGMVWVLPKPTQVVRRQRRELW